MELARGPASDLGTRLRIIEMLLAAGAEVGLQDVRGDTAVHHAARQGCVPSCLGGGTGVPGEGPALTISSPRVERIIFSGT